MVRLLTEMHGHLKERSLSWKCLSPFIKGNHFSRTETWPPATRMPTFRGYSERKEFLLMGNKFFPFRVSHLQKGGNYSQIRVISLEVYPFTSVFSLLFFYLLYQWYMCTVSYKAIYKYVNNSFRNKIFSPITFSIWNTSTLKSLSNTNY